MHGDNINVSIYKESNLFFVLYHLTEQIISLGYKTINSSAALVLLLGYDHLFFNGP